MVKNIYISHLSTIYVGAFYKYFYRINEPDNVNINMQYYSGTYVYQNAYELV